MQINYDDNDLERYAFAIDPDGSKDRDDAISCFYLKNGNIITNNNDASLLIFVCCPSEMCSCFKL